jgi:hypothetical protein
MLTPIVPGEFSVDTEPPRMNSQVLFDLPDMTEDEKRLEKPLDAENLQILVAEDDPVNSRILQKRLERSGHEVTLTMNGQECAAAYEEKSSFFDVSTYETSVGKFYSSFF